MHKVCVCVAVWLWLSPCVLLCLFSFYDLYLRWQYNHMCMFWPAFLCTSAPMCIPFMQISLSVCLSANSVWAHTLTIECLCCHQGPFCAVSVSSCLKQTGRVYCVPSWHAPWDNERLYFGLDCWLRIIQQHKQATVQPCVHTWSVLGSKRQAQIWS